MGHDQLIVVAPSRRLKLLHKICRMPYPLIGYLGLAMRLWYTDLEDTEDGLHSILSDIGNYYDESMGSNYIEDINERVDLDELFIEGLVDYIGEWDCLYIPHKRLCDVKIRRSSLVLLFTNKETVRYEPRIILE